MPLSATVDACHVPSFPLSVSSCFSFFFFFFPSSSQALTWADTLAHHATLVAHLQQAVAVEGVKGWVGAAVCVCGIAGAVGWVGEQQWR